MATPFVLQAPREATMADTPETLTERWYEERQSVWLYRELASIEKDARRAGLFAGLADAAELQAGLVEADLKAAGGTAPPFRATPRARFVIWLARTLGTGAVRSMLAGLKVRGLSAWDPPTPGVGHASPASVEDVGRRHRGTGGGTLRAAVFGINDGLCSNTSLILGIAGASASDEAILTSAIAGLLAGAFSMAAGEYVSMRSQRELFEHQIAEERDELTRYPEQEAEELALIYAARGLSIDEARALSKRLVADRESALVTLAREELGVNPDDLGSPWGAAISSFLAFAAGAILPLIPFLLHLGVYAVPTAVAIAAVSLFAVGGALSLFSGRSAILGGLRMLGIGALAGGSTYGIGRLVGGVV